MGSIHGSGRSPGGGHGNPLQYSCLENPHGQRSLVGYNPYSTNPKAPRPGPVVYIPLQARTGKDGYPHPVRQAKSKRGQLLLPPLVVLLRSSQIGGCPPHWGRQATLLSPPIQALFSPRNTVTDTQKQGLFKAPCGPPRWHIKFIITTAVSPVLIPCLT